MNGALATLLAALAFTIPTPPDPAGPGQPDPPLITQPPTPPGLVVVLPAPAAGSGWTLPAGSAPASALGPGLSSGLLPGQVATVPGQVVGGAGRALNQITPPVIGGVCSTVNQATAPVLGGLGLDLGHWKLTLPTGSSGHPTEVKQPKLGDSALTRWFTGAPAGGAVFRAPVDGVTTSGSRNPRSELREMAADGSPAAWSSTSGTHTMSLTEAFTHLPTGKPQLVGAQIHDASDDITVIRVEGSNLWVTDGNNPHYKLITDHYQLGTPFDIRYVVAGGQIHIFYNGQEVATQAKSFSGAYFKAGAYTQANCSNASPCSDSNYGETTLYKLNVTHTPGAGGGGR